MGSTINSLRMLAIDDDDLVRSFIVSLCEEEGWRVEEAENGPQAIEMVRNHSEKYQVALLDYRMPGPSGLEVLPELLKYGQDLAVIMMSGYAEVETAVEAMKNGAFDLIQKPIEPEVLVTRIEKTIEQRQLRIEHRQYVSGIEKRVAERSSELEAARKATIFGLARLVESRDSETGFHLERMADYVITLALALRKMGLYRDILTDNYIDLLFESAPLHDIGKVGIPDKVLQKPGKLTDQEYEIIKTHTTIGVEAIKDIKKKVKGQNFLDLGIEIAGCHHEYFNGQGYPRGLEGHKIPLSARILTLADFYDALAFPRIYRPEAYSHQEIKKMIQERVNTNFDPDVNRAFLQCEREFQDCREKYGD